MDEVMMDLLPEDQRPDPNAPLTVVDVMFRTGTKVYFFDPGELEVPAGANVIIDTSRGVEFGTCSAGNHTVRTAEVVMPLRKVIRIATPADKKMAEENWAKEKSAYDICLKKIEEHQLDMQLVSAEYAFDGSKILFFFTADERVDFRELVKNLASMFHTRIELRQIGVRDKAKMVGGLGICGRPFCCASFLEDFQPVSIKMAKTQNLSLNPTKISGTCGRLMCCLKYEQDAYEDLLRSAPKVESLVDTPEGRGTVVESDLLRQRVKVRLEDRPEDLAFFANSDIAVLRSGKAKKNEQAIPAEMAPISGAVKKVKREEPEKEQGFAPIRFKFREEAVVEEPEKPAESAAEAEEPSREGRKNHRRRKNRPHREQQEKQPAEKPAEKQEAGGEKPKNRHYHHRHHRGNGNKQQ